MSNIEPITKEEEAILEEPFTYITQVSGKGIRSMLINAFNIWMNVPDDKLEKIKDVTKILHNASLLIDDIEDNSKLRRGIPVAHSVYGIPQTINCANLMYFKSMALINDLGKSEAASIFTDQLLELHRGQGMDIYWRDAVQCPTEKQYRRMVLQKTGGLFMLALKLMQLFSEDKRDYLPLLQVFGLYFQIRDDYANLQSKEYEDNKSYCEDITEGKFSFPLIHSIRSTPDDRQVLNILKLHTDDMKLKRHCLDCLKKTNSFEYTIKELNKLEKQAREMIADLGGNDILMKILDHLSVLHHQEE
eukprot:m.222025 g.222025  ORF g.222025 m.222025 type:complete len:303 (-) comp13849_c2_seq1:2929-3837(-)